MTSEKEYREWEKLGVSKKNVDEHRIKPDKYISREPDNAKVEKNLRVRVRELRDLGLSESFIEASLKLGDSGVEFTRMSDEALERIIKESCEKLREVRVARQDKVYTEEEIRDTVENRHGSREIMEKHNRGVLRRRFWEGAWQFTKDVGVFTILLVLIFAVVVIFFL